MGRKSIGCVVFEVSVYEMGWMEVSEVVGETELSHGVRFHPLPAEKALESYRYRHGCTDGRDYIIYPSTRLFPLTSTPKTATPTSVVSRPD